MATTKEETQALLNDIQEMIDEHTLFCGKCGALNVCEVECAKCGNIMVEVIEFQSDSPHASLLGSALGLGRSGSDALGLTNVSKALKAIQDLSGAIGDATGMTGIFDQPSLPIMCEAAQAVVNLPQPTRSLFYHKEDYVSDQKEFVSGCSGMSSMLERCKIPALLNTVEWDKTTASATKLWECLVCPMFAPVTNYESLNTPLSYYSKFFRKWRGSLDYTIEVVSTAMHQGQLFIAFNPQVSNTATEVSRDKLRTCPYTIMDVSTTRRLTQRITYLGENDYKSTVEMPPQNELAIPFSSVVGSLYIYVQNKLMAPSTVSSKVDVNVYVSAGDDFEFMDPFDANWTLFYDLGVLQSESYAHLNKPDKETGVMWGEDESQAIEGGAKITPVPEDASKESTSVTKARVMMIDQLKVKPNVSAEEICANVATAHTQNVAGRDYLVQSDVQWTVTQPKYARLTRLPIPNILWQDDLAVEGLRKYHAFQHMDFEVRFKVNPSKFHAGKLIAFFVPDVDTSAAGHESKGSWTQYNHAFIDLQGETECVLKVPYSYYKRMMGTKDLDNYGTVLLYVWNVLRTGSGETESALTVSAFIKPVAPYIGVKCVKLQSDDKPSDSAVGTTKLVSAFKEQVTTLGLGLSKRGYVRSKHMDLKDLLRRPDFLGTFRHTTSTTARWQTIAHIAAFGGRTHQAIIDTYTYWTGSNKLTFITNLGVSQDIQLAVGYESIPPVQYAEVYASVTDVTDVPAMNGMTFIEPANRGQFTVEIPMYKVSPMVRCQRTPGGGWSRPTASPSIWATTTQANLMPQVCLYCFGARSVPLTFDVSIFHSIGDDFQLFLPRAVGYTRKSTAIYDGALIPAFTSATAPTGWTLSNGGYVDAWEIFDRNLKTSCTIEGASKEIKVSNTAKASVAFVAIAAKADIVEQTFSVTVGSVTSAVYIPAFQSFVVAPFPVPSQSMSFTISSAKKAVVYEAQMYGALTPTQLYSVSERLRKSYLPISVVEEEEDEFVHLQSDDNRVELQVFGISSCVSKVQEMFKDARAAVEGLKTIGEVATKVGSSSAAILHPDAINSALQFLNKLMDDSLMFVSGMLMLAKGDQLMASIGLIQLGKLLLGYVAPKLSQPRHTVQLQSEQCDYPSWVRAYAKYAKAALSAISGYNTRNLRKYVEIMMEGKKGMDLVLGAIESILNYVVQGDKVLYVHVSDKAARFVKTMVAGVTVDNVKELLKMRSEIDILVMSLERERLPPTYAHYSKKLDDAVIELERVGASLTAIPEPIGMYFCSEPGTGKSTVLCKLLPAMLMNLLGVPAEDYNKFTVNMTLDGQGRCDAYDGQPFAIIDEFGSNRESGEAAMVIKLISQFTEPVQSALLEKKGKSFRSRVLMLLSNIPSVSVHSAKVNNPEAFKRRFMGRSFKVTAKSLSDANGELVPVTFNYKKFFDGIKTILKSGDSKSKFNKVAAYTDQFLQFRYLDIDSGHVIESMDPPTFGSIVRNLKREWQYRAEAFSEAEDIMRQVAMQSDDAGDDALILTDDDSVVTAFEGCVSGDEEDDDEVDVSSGLKIAVDELKDARPEGLPSVEDMGRELLYSEAVKYGRREDIMAMWCDMRLLKTTSSKEFMALAKIALESLREEGVNVEASTSCGKSKVVAESRDELARWLASATELDKPVYPGLDGWWHSMIKVAGLGVAITAVVMGVRKIFSYMTSVFGELQSGYSSDAWKLRAKPTGTAGLNTVMLQDKPSDERHEKIRRNMRKMRIKQADGTIQTSTTVTCLTNKLVVTNQHFLKQCKAGESVVEISEHDYDGTILRFTPIAISGTTVVRIPDDRDMSDLVVIHLGNFTVSRARDITSFLPSRGDATGVVDAVLLAMNYDHDMDGKVEIGKWCNVVHELKSGEHQTMRVTRGFKFFTVAGDCGRPYVQYSNVPLLGFHCAAYVHGDKEGRVGLIPLYKEDLETKDNVEGGILQSLEHEQVVVQCEMETDVDKERMPIPVLRSVRINNTMLTTHQNPESSIIRMTKNGIRFNHPEWPDDMRPASLRKFGEINPWKVGSSKYIPKQVYPVPTVVHNMLVRYWSNLVSGSPRVYTLHEAINGTSDPEGMRPLQWSTGMGVWAIFKDKGKRALFVNEGDDQNPVYKLSAAAYQVKHPIYGVTFAERLEIFEDMIRRGVVPFSPWLATLKDELRPSVKVSAGKTRLFEQPGVDYTIMIRKYFGSFLDWYKSRAGFEWCHGIGQDKETVWKRYYEGLCEVGHGRNGFDIDYSGYDGSVCQQAFGFFTSVTDKFYEAVDTPANKLARHSLVEGLRSAYVVMKDWVIETTQGNKSGNAMTDVFNSITNVYIIHAAILILQRAANLKLEPSIFHSDMRVLVYGDDAIVTVTDAAQKWIDPVQLEYVMAKFGYVITSGAKGEVGAYQHVTKLQYLKSGFVPSHGVVWAPMPMQDIVKELQWVKKSVADDDVDFNERIRRTRTFVSHHGKDAYAMFTQQLRDLGVRRGLLLTSWEDEVEAIAARQDRCVITSSPYAVAGGLF